MWFKLKCSGNETLYVLLDFVIVDLKMSTTCIVQKSKDMFHLPTDVKERLLASRDLNRNNVYPEGATPLENQVAGHSIADGKSTVGMLRHKDGYVLKPLIKPVQAKRELKFYQDLQVATDEASVELKRFVPKFYGTTTMHIGDKDVEFLVLKNTTLGYSDPCIMDIKIGRQTWDPDATKEKIEGEKQKYTQCKEELGFCIPGFQVHQLSTGNIVRMGKEYGKRLNKRTVADAMKLFLNADSGLSRELIMLFLVNLWKILEWCRRQHKFRIYSSSLLLVYDAKKLRQILDRDGSVRSTSPKPDQPVAWKKCSGICNEALPSPGCATSTNFSTVQSPGRLGTTVTVMEKPPSSSSEATQSPSVVPVSTSPFQEQSISNVFEDSWHAIYDKIQRTYSFTIDFEKDLQSLKESYMLYLGDLMCSDTPSSKGLWASVKMIDFAHVFPAPDDELDTNYLGGLETLAKLFEDLLSEAL